MKFTDFPDVKIIADKRFQDDRGFFLESYNQRVLKELGIDRLFVQDNLSRSYKNVLRGLHCQMAHPQGKLIRVLSGTVFDVIVDLRKNSPTFGKWAGMQLSASDCQMVWIPEGFAHGFLVLSEQADFFYKTTDFYDSQSEICLRWNDPTVAIEWPIKVAPSLSHKDSQGISLKEFEKRFSFL